MREKCTNQNAVKLEEKSYRSIHQKKTTRCMIKEHGGAMPGQHENTE